MNKILLAIVIGVALPLVLACDNDKEKIARLEGELAGARATIAQRTDELRVVQAKYVDGKRANEELAAANAALESELSATKDNLASANAALTDAKAQNAKVTRFHQMAEAAGWNSDATGGDTTHGILRSAVNVCLDGVWRDASDAHDRCVLIYGALSGFVNSIRNAESALR